jgi:tRNA (mo5U34)-methyltransferase
LWKSIAVDAAELEARIAAFPGWHYSFQFDNGVSTPVSDPGAINRHEQRRRYFFAALLELSGGSLQGRRVLDLGCNSGFWALNALDAGADFVLGVDAQQPFIDQAQLVFEQKQLDPARYRFEQGNVFGHDFSERFDVVLCLGLMDHVSRPFELFQLMAGVGAELIVLETTISRSRLSLFEVSRMYQRKDVIDSSLALVPSREAVNELAAEFGYDTRALAVNIADFSGLPDYRAKRRLAFMCSRSTPLGGLAAEQPAGLIPWWVRDPRALSASYR